MLTKEQKIDFLKCCIAAYEDERVQERMKDEQHKSGKRFYGFCRMMERYTMLFRLEYNGLSYLFPAFLDHISFSGYEDNYGYYFPLTAAGARRRAQVARKFLLKEYGIKYSKKKVKNKIKPKRVFYPFTCEMR